jgi:hypothetical protein
LFYTITGSSELAMNQDYVEKINDILCKHFSDNSFLIANASMESVPLVSANILKSTRSFSAGQLVYIYDIYWGMNERAKVIGRYRRKHNFILGVCPIASLTNCRPKLVYKPVIVSKLNGSYIDGGIFMRFFNLPGGFTHISEYLVAIKSTDNKSLSN